MTGKFERWLHELGRVLPGGGARQRFLAGFERGLQELDDAEQVMAYAARSLGEYLGADRCAYAEAEGDQDHFLMSGDYATGLPPLPGRFAMSAFGNGCLAAMRAGESWIVADSLHDERLEAADLNAYRVTGIRAVICVPLLRGGRFAAAMAVHQATVRHWTEAEIELVELIVIRCWESIQRTHVGRALRDSEQRHRLLVERATDAIWVLDRDLRLVEINAAACDLLGYDHDKLLGTSITGLLDENGAAGFRQLISDPDAVRETTEVHQVRRADGTQVALELSIQATPSGVQAIGRDVTERRRREAERELLLQQEHEIAQTLQRSLLPRELPSIPRVAAAARYLPAAAHAQTGGDWYELIRVGDSQVALSVGDVVGKGPQAAAVMGQLRSALASSLLDGHGPAAALERLDKFAARTTGASGTSCACLTLDWETGELRWALAGHPPPVVVADGVAHLLHGGGNVLGGPDRARYREETTTLAPGASVVLYTDGLIERREERIDEGLGRLRETVAGAHTLAPEPLVAAVTEALLDSGREDDVAILCVRLTPPPLQGHRAAELTVLRQLRAEVSGWAALAALPDELRDDLNLALTEAVANSVEHAYAQDAGAVTYSVTRTAAGDLDVVVTDAGKWRPEPADNGHRGRGIGIIKAVSESATFDGDEHGTKVCFRIAGGKSAVTTTSEPIAATPANVSVEVAGDALVLRVTGDLDLTTVSEVRPVLLHEIEAAQGLDRVIDLTGLRYLSSCGIALLLEAAALAARQDATVTARATAGSAPLRILELAGLTGAETGSLTVEAVTAQVIGLPPVTPMTSPVI